ncbi:FACT complex subunit SPT16 [Rosa sericea]
MYRKGSEFFMVDPPLNSNYKRPTSVTPIMDTAARIAQMSTTHRRIFGERLKFLYSHWNKHRSDMWGCSDVIAIGKLSASKDPQYRKSTALNVWLVGFEFPETMMVFTKKIIHFFCNQGDSFNPALLRMPAMKAVGVDIVRHVIRDIDVYSALMDNLLRDICAQAKADGHEIPVVGHIGGEDPEGFLFESWSEKLKNANFRMSDVTNGLSDLLSVKDNEELVNVKRAAFLTTKVMNNIVVPNLEFVINHSEKVTHSFLMDEMVKAIQEPSKAFAKLINVENIGICYPPILQSGVGGNDELLSYDSASVVICAFGSRYKSYCSNVARTFLVDPNPFQRKAHEILLKAHDAAISELRPGNKASSAYQAARSVVEMEAPELAPNLTESAGTGIGIELVESRLKLNANNDLVLKAGMVFNVSLGFEDLQSQSGLTNSKDQSFSLLLADTVVINNVKPEVLTVESAKAIKVPSKMKQDANGTEDLRSSKRMRFKLDWNDELDGNDKPTFSVVSTQPSTFSLGVPLLWSHSGLAPADVQTDPLNARERLSYAERGKSTGIKPTEKMDMLIAKYYIDDTKGRVQLTERTVPESQTETPPWQTERASYGIPSWKRERSSWKRERLSSFVTPPWVATPALGTLDWKTDRSVTPPRQKQGAFGYAYCFF